MELVQVSYHSIHRHRCCHYHHHLTAVFQNHSNAVENDPLHEHLLVVNDSTTMSPTPRWPGTLKPHLHDTTCRQTGLTTGCIVYTNIQLVVKPVWQPVWQPAVSCIAGCQTGCTTRFDNRLNEQWLFVHPVVQPVWQPAVSCKQTSNRLSERFDNHLYHVNGVQRYYQSTDADHLLLLYSCRRCCDNRPSYCS